MEVAGTHAVAIGKALLAGILLVDAIAAEVEAALLGLAPWRLRLRLPLLVLAPRVCRGYCSLAEQASQPLKSTIALLAHPRP